MRPPFTVHEFSIVLAALAEGFVLQAIEGEDHPVIPIDSVEWTLFGIAIQALVSHMTMPSSVACHAK